MSSIEKQVEEYFELIHGGSDGKTKVSCFFLFFFFFFSPFLLHYIVVFLLLRKVTLKI